VFIRVCKRHEQPQQGKIQQNHVMRELGLPEETDTSSHSSRTGNHMRQTVSSSQQSTTKKST